MVQQFRKSITALALFVVVGLASAQPTQPPLSIKPDAPDRYIVVPGDTLWGISERFTDSPWRWPELWGMNREQIRNPHLIYPGYVIILDRERARLSIASGEAGAAATTPSTGTAGTAGTAVAPGTVKLTPRVRTEALAKEQIPSIPPGVIEPFLTRPLVVEPDGLDKAPTIVGTQANRVVLAAGNSAYVRGIGTSKEDNWYVYRKGKELVDPDTNRTLAYEAIYLGTAQIVRPGEPATILLNNVVQEVGAGDKLVPAARLSAPSYAPHAPNVQIVGRIMAIYGGVGRVGEAGRLSIVTLNRGRAEGLEVGNVLALYAAGGTARDLSRARNAPDANIKLPDERTGLVFVFRVFERVSYALVMNTTAQVTLLDVVRTP
jgi:hypothetical protein